MKIEQQPTPQSETTLESVGVHRFTLTRKGGVWRCLVIGDSGVSETERKLFVMQLSMLVASLGGCLQTSTEESVDA